MPEKKHRFSFLQVWTWYAWSVAVNLHHTLQEGSSAQVATLLRVSEPQPGVREELPLKLLSTFMVPFLSLRMGAAFCRY